MGPARQLGLQASEGITEGGISHGRRTPSIDNKLLQQKELRIPNFRLYRSVASDYTTVPVSQKMTISGG